jgi:hypothetical protein
MLVYIEAIRLLTDEESGKTGAANPHAKHLNRQRNIAMYVATLKMIVMTAFDLASVELQKKPAIEQSHRVVVRTVAHLNERKSKYVREFPSISGSICLHATTNNATVSSESLVRQKEAKRRRSLHEIVDDSVI